MFINVCEKNVFVGIFKRPITPSCVGLSTREGGICRVCYLQGVELVIQVVCLVFTLYLLNSIVVYSTNNLYVFWFCFGTPATDRLADVEQIDLVVLLRYRTAYNYNLNIIRCELQTVKGKTVINARCISFLRSSYFAT